MPATINPIRKSRIKQGLIKHKGNARKALEEIGAGKYTINSSTNDKCVKLCMGELRQEAKKTEITIDSIVNELDELKILAIKKKDYSTAARIVELKGKTISAFTERLDVSGNIDFTQEKAAREKRLSLLGLN